MKIDISDLLCHKFAFLAKTNARVIDAQMNQFDLSRTQWKVLLRFNFLPIPCTQQQLLKSVDIDRAHLTRTLDQLEQRKLITRTRLSHDKRAFNISPTLKGKELLKKMEQIMRDESNAMIKGINEKEIQLLDKLIHKVTANILNELGEKYEDHL